MGYEQVQNTTDFTLKRFSIEQVYLLVTDIVILHEDLEIISFLISRTAQWSRDLANAKIKFCHFFLARRYGPANKLKCLDFIMEGKAARCPLPPPSSSSSSPYSLTNPSVWILLKDKNGLQFGDGDPWQCKVPKGEFIIEIPKDKTVQSDDDKKPAPNYRLYRDDTYVVFHAGHMDVVPLQEKEYGYLQAIGEPAVRLQEYLKPDNKKKMKLDLVVGDVVMFKMKVNSDAIPSSIARGLIRYIGPIQERMGTHFGIEIQVSF